MSLGLPVLNEASWMLDGWATSIEQCRTADDLAAAEARLHRTLENNRSRSDALGGPRDAKWIRDALALCA